jgi:hypothetical protein
VKKHLRKSIISAVTLFGLALVGFTGAQTGFRNLNDAWGPRYQSALHIPKPSKHPGPHGTGPANRIRHWNEIAINASGFDHTPLAPGENRVFGEQLGPVRASRAIAIVHIAIFEALRCPRTEQRAVPTFLPLRNKATVAFVEISRRSNARDVDGLMPDSRSQFACRLDCL